MTHLQALVSRHQAKAAQVAAQSVDWNQRKAKWLSALAQLVGQVGAALAAAGVPADAIAVTQHRITEEALGTYDAPGLEVRIGTATVRFVPVASVIIGGHGRVDVIGPNGEVKLIAGDDTDVDARTLHNPQEPPPVHERVWVWSAYPDKSRRGGFLLNDEGLTRVLEQVLGSA